MKKIPVLDSIRYAYAFTFGHLGTIIGLIWLPMVILTVPGYFVMSHYYAIVPAAVSAGNAAAAGQAALLLIGWSLVSLLLFSVMYVAVTRQALGLRQGPAVVHFVLGAPEFRVFGAVLALVALMVFFMLLGLTLGGAAHAVAGKTSAAGPIMSLVILALLLAIIYAMVRLSFLLIPATVMEEVVGLARAWELSAGNFWRIVGIGIGTMGPIVVVAMLAEVILFGPGAFTQGAMRAHDAAKQAEQMAAQMREMAKHLPALYGLYFLLAPFSMGLGMSGAAYAYRALTAPDRAAPPARQAP